MLDYYYRNTSDKNIKKWEPHNGGGILIKIKKRRENEGTEGVTRRGRDYSSAGWRTRDPFSGFLQSA